MECSYLLSAFDFLAADETLESMTFLQKLSLATTTFSEAALTSREPPLQAPFQEQEQQQQQQQLFALGSSAVDFD